MQTIKSNSDISLLFKEGKRYSNRYISFIVKRRKEDVIEHDRNGRVAFIAGKKNGNAVWRNRAKRRMREIYRELDIESLDVNMLMVAKHSILAVPFNKVLVECSITLDKYID